MAGTIKNFFEDDGDDDHPKTTSNMKTLRENDAPSTITPNLHAEEEEEDDDDIEEIFPDPPYIDAPASSSRVVPKRTVPESEPSPSSKRRRLGEPIPEGEPFISTIRVSSILGIGYLGDFLAEGWSTTSDIKGMSYISSGDEVTIERDAADAGVITASPPKKAKPKSSAKQTRLNFGAKAKPKPSGPPTHKRMKENNIVRFLNMGGSGTRHKHFKLLAPFTSFVSNFLRGWTFA